MNEGTQQHNVLFLNDDEDTKAEGTDTKEEVDGQQPWDMILLAYTYL